MHELTVVNSVYMFGSLGAKKLVAELEDFDFGNTLPFMSAGVIKASMEESSIRLDSLNTQQPPPPPPPDTLHQLLHSPLLFDPVRKPRYPIVLCHGQSSVSPFFFRLPELTFCMPSWKVYMASMSVAQLRFPCSGHTTGRMCSMYSGELSAPRSSSPAFPALAPS